jgi:hypothetical protein
MEAINLNGYYAVYDSANDNVWAFKTGEIQLFGHYMEAEEHCSEHQTPIHCTELSLLWQQIIIEQIKSKL